MMGFTLRKRNARQEEPPDSIPGHASEGIYTTRFCNEHYERHLGRGGVTGRYRAMQGLESNRGVCDYRGCKEQSQYRETLGKDLGELAGAELDGHFEAIL